MLANIDSVMMARIDKLNVNIQYKDRLKCLWEDNTASEEEKSDRIWEQKESFLKKKKHSEIQSGNFQTCTKSWEEVMRERNKKENKPHRSRNGNTDQCVQDDETLTPGPCIS